MWEMNRQPDEQSPAAAGQSLPVGLLCSTLQSCIRPRSQQAFQPKPDNSSDPTFEVLIQSERFLPSAGADILAEALSINQSVVNRLLMSF